LHELGSWIGDETSKREDELKREDEIRCQAFIQLMVQTLQSYGLITLTTHSPGPLCSLCHTVPNMIHPGDICIKYDRITEFFSGSQPGRQSGPRAATGCKHNAPFHVRRCREDGPTLAKNTASSPAKNSGGLVPVATSRYHPGAHRRFYHQFW
jgi:hypothetical protein